MNSDAAAAAFASWKFEPGLVAGLLLAAILYARGWQRLQSRAPHRFPPWRLGCFLGGIVTIFFALTSPLDAFANFLLSIHMVQHLLLTMVAPPLLLLGAPWLPILLGLPRRLTADVLGPFLTWAPLRAAAAFLTHPVTAWLLFAISNVAWHTPPLYELALHSTGWHRVEHGFFLGTALLFWWNVILPWPTHQTRPRWIVIPYLLLADFQNTALAAFFSFYDRVLYPTYAAAPRVTDLNALSDQAAAGAIMWVPGSIAFLIPCGFIAVQFLSRKKTPPPPPPRRAAASGILFAFLISKFKSALPRLPLTKLRRPLQFALLLLAALVVWDGFTGPQVSAMNAAGVLPWTHWRGLTVLALVFAGNLFCLSCPFMLVRDTARRIFGSRQLPWPHFLRNKWLPVALIAIYLWAYEGFSLWDRPWATAALIVGYFAAATLIDGLFKGASFCKYVCPIGQFHFVQSLASPSEIRIREPDVCRTCRTFDCIKGNATRRGCELQLFQPKKSGNMDCTFCLDCVSACPHDNVALQRTLPASDLWNPAPRSSIGRWESRPDLAALVLVLTFGAFANAAGMITPIQSLAPALGLSHLAFTTLFIAISLVFLPLSTTFAAASLTRPHERTRASVLRTLAAYAISLAPLGFGMWLAHFVFHLLTASHTPIPVFQRLFGLEPDWTVASWAWPGLLGIELLFLDAGFLLTLYAAWRIAKNRSPRPLRAALPWAALAAALYVAGTWIIFQPMQMRGTLTP
ncbi:MAG: cytochrome c oxidase assembly protein [Terrimicrobiaceae bacterium]|nr:cytochrome c oxidase assembly protein [Terrimicrobiaceae bacterium]